MVVKMAQVSQRDSGYSMPENIHSWAGQGFEQPDQVLDVPAHCRRVRLGDV